MCDNKWFRWQGSDLELAIKVVTRAKRSEFGQVRSGRLVVRVSAPPVEGKANSELLKFLASSFGCSQRNVNLRTGLRSREKRAQIKAPFQMPEFLSSSLKRDLVRSDRYSDQWPERP